MERVERPLSELSIAELIDILHYLNLKYDEKFDINLFIRNSDGNQQRLFHQKSSRVSRDGTLVSLRGLLGRTP